MWLFLFPHQTHEPLMHSQSETLRSQSFVNRPARHTRNKAGGISPRSFRLTEHCRLLRGEESDEADYEQAGADAFNERRGAGCNHFFHFFDHEHGIH